MGLFDFMESTDEMEQIVRASGVRLQISHHKALGKPNWGKVRQSMAKIDALQAAGFDLTFDQYPWTAACTGLKVCCPGWAYEGGEQGFQHRLLDPAAYQQILGETREEIAVRGGAAYFTARGPRRHRHLLLHCGGGCRLCHAEPLALCMYGRYYRRKAPSPPMSIS